MTVETFIQSKQLYPEHIYFEINDVIKWIKEFTLLKCAEQREICAENATGQIDQFRNFEDHDDVIIDRDSILNSENPKM